MKTVEEIIVEKEFNELTQDELTMVAELAETEQEYAAMRSLFTQMNTEIIPGSQFEASPAIKQSLDSIFMAKHPVIAQDWKREEEPAEEDKVVPLYNKTWFRAAAVLLLFSGTSYYYLQNSEVLTNEKGAAKRQVAMSTPSKAKDEVNASTRDNNEIRAKSSIDAKAIPSEKTLSWASAESMMSDEPIAIDDANMDYFSDAPVTKFIAGPDKSKGLNADLYPNGSTYGATVSVSEDATTAMTSNDELKDESTSSDVSTSEMLDWIQTLY